MRQHGCRGEAIAALNVARRLFVVDLTGQTQCLSDDLHFASVAKESPKAAQESVFACSSLIGCAFLTWKGGNASPIVAH
jgi:hypothetical protein